MSGRRLIVVGAAAIALVVALLAYVTLRGKKDKKKGAAVTADAGPAAGRREPAPEPPKGESSGPPPGVQLAYDDDPEGAMRLEGLVLDSEERPVAGALVAISSNPPRTLKTEDDGTFVFDKLLAREYSLEARHGDDVGGPLKVRVNDKVQPVTI